MSTPPMAPPPAGPDPTVQDRPSTTDGATAPAERIAAGPPRPTWRERARQGRPLLISLGVVVIVAVLSALLFRPPNSGEPLGPNSTDASGAKAIAQVLGDRGVSVQRVARFADIDSLTGRDRTVLVVGSHLLGPAQLDRVTKVATRIVVLSPDAQTLDALGMPLEPATFNAPRAMPARCDLPAAQAAGPTELDGTLFTVIGPRVPADVTLCYPGLDQSGQPDPMTGTIAVLDTGDVTITAVGSSDVLRNDAMTRPGHAALGLWALGDQDELVWWMVDPFDPALELGGFVDPLSLLPDWVGAVETWLLCVVVIAIAWRARRMGRLVPEPLPVVVRAAETARGRAALYRRAGARDRAAAVLRADTLRRLARRVGLPASAPATDVALVVASHCGVPLALVQQVLVGPPPPDDAALTALAGQLDYLVQQLGDIPGASDTASTRKAP